MCVRSYTSRGLTVVAALTGGRCASGARSDAAAGVDETAFALRQGGFGRPFRSQGSPKLWGVSGNHDVYLPMHIRIAREAPTRRSSLTSIC
jgi:hypothetical protein